MTQAGGASAVIVALNDYESRQPNVHAGGTARGVAMDSPAAAPSGHHVMGMASHSVRGPSMGWPRADPAGASCAGPCAGHFHHLWRCRGGGPCHQRKPTIVQRSPWRPRWTSAPFAAVPRWTKRQARPVPGVEMPCTGRCQPVPFSALRTCAPAAGVGDAPEQEGVRWPDRPTSGAAPLWSGQGRWPRVRSTRASSSWKAGFLG